MTWFKWNCCIFFFLYTVFVLLPYLVQAEGDGFVYHYVWALLWVWALFIRPLDFFFFRYSFSLSAMKV